MRQGIMYRSEYWGVNKNIKIKMMVAENRVLRWMCGVARMDRELRMNV